MDPGSPVGLPPPGVASNFVNPPNRASLAYGSLITSVVLVTFFTWFRILVKCFIVGKLHLEDYFLPVAWVAAIGQMVPFFLIYSFAPIIHSWDMPFSNYERYLLLFRVSAIFYNASILLIKVAILVQVLRIFIARGAHTKTFYALHALIWMNVVFYVVMLFLMIFTCQPVSKAWRPWIPGKCLKMGSLAMATATLNVLSDLTILFITQKVIWNVLRADRSARLQLSIVFVAGVIPSTFACLCLYYNSIEMTTKDFIHDSSLMSLACYGEIVGGMFVLWITTVPRFFTHINKKAPALRFPFRERRSEPIEIITAGAPEKVIPVEPKGGRSIWHISYSERALSCREEEDSAWLATEQRTSTVSLGSRATSSCESEASFLSVPVHDKVP